MGDGDRVPAVYRSNNMNAVRKTAQKESFFTKTVLGLSTAGIIATVGFLWNVNGQLEAMKKEDEARQEKVLEIKESVNNIEEDVNGIKEKDMQDIKDRLKTLEIKNEKDK